MRITVQTVSSLVLKSKSEFTIQKCYNISILNSMMLKCVIELLHFNYEKGVDDDDITGKISTIMRFNQSHQITLERR